jgi:hypothetical protein
LHVTGSSLALEGGASFFKPRGSANLFLSGGAARGDERRGAVAVCSSRIDHAAGVVEITSPSATCNVGDRFLIVGGLSHQVAVERSLRKSSMSFATWAARLGLPQWSSAAVVPDSARLDEAREMGLVHDSLLEPPGELAA